MDDIEIIRTESDILREAEQNLQILKVQQENDKTKMREEMYILIEEMDSVLKEKSDQERNFNQVKRKMEKSLIDCQEIINSLQSELKSSERSVTKARADLKQAQDRCKATEDKYAEVLNTVEVNRKETALLQKKISELNYVIEQKSLKNAELQKLYVEERDQNDENSYLKDYVEFLETEMQQERKCKQSVEFKDKVIKQLTKDHTIAIDSLKFQISEHQKELESLRSQLQKKDQLIIENYSTIMKQQVKINLLNDSHNKSKVLAICPPAEVNLSQPIESSSENEKEEEEVYVSKPEDITKPYVLPSKKKLILINDPSSATTFISCMTGLEDQNEKLRHEIESWEKLFKNIDIDTYLTQVEYQVDEMYLKHIYEGRNAILKKHLDATLRGIRQLCDYHNINMEYTI